MVSVGRDDTILLRNCGFHTDGDGLLAVVEVAEAADEFGFVERVGGYFHSPHHRHVAKEGHEFLRRGLDGSRRRVDVVAGEGDAGLDGDCGGGVGGEVAEVGDSWG